MLDNLRHLAVAIAGRLLLAALSFGVALVAAEVALRLLRPAAERGEDVGSYGFIAYHPRLGWAPVAGAQGRIASDELDAEVMLNDQGLRGTRTYARERHAGVPRAVAVGDSFTFGYGVGHEQTWVTRVERSLAPAELINLAVTGYGTDQQLLRLESEGLAWQPDLVLVGLFEGNVFRNARREQVGFPKPRFELDEAGGLRLVGVPVPRTVPRPGLLARTALARTAGGPARALFEHLGGGSAWPVTEAILARMRSVVEERGAALLAVVIPKDQAVHGSGLRRRLHEHTLARIAAMLERLGIDYVDTTAALVRGAEAGERMYFHTDGHWTAAGHRHAAAAVVRHLRESGRGVGR